MIEVKVECDSCDALVDLNAKCFFCTDCEEEKDMNYTIDEVKKAIQEHFKEGLDKFLDMDYYDKPFSGFKSKEELDIYIRGIKWGYRNAYFDVADHFGIIGNEPDDNPEIETLIWEYGRVKLKKEDENSFTEVQCNS